MDTLRVNDPTDKSYPFDRLLYEDSLVLYHGTWSSWTDLIEANGLVRGRLPFALQDIALIAHHRDLIGLGSRCKGLSPGTQVEAGAQRDIYLSAGFWHARAYATDPGGETVRLAIEEAMEFESFAADDRKRVSLCEWWESGLRTDPTHERTRQAAEILRDSRRIRELGNDVQTVRERLSALVVGGFPVVYAIRVQPGWLKKGYYQRLLGAMRIRLYEINLACDVECIPAHCFLAKVEYPNGIDGEYLQVFRTSWTEATAKH